MIIDKAIDKVSHPHGHFQPDSSKCNDGVHLLKSNILGSKLKFERNVIRHVNLLLLLICLDRPDRLTKAALYDTPRHIVSHEYSEVFHSIKDSDFIFVI